MITEYLSLADRIRQELDDLVRPERIERLAGQMQPVLEQVQMETFAHQVEHPLAAEQLQEALSGRGSFRRFKDVLSRFPAVREAWFDFQSRRRRRRYNSWRKLLACRPAYAMCRLNLLPISCKIYLDC